MLSCTGFGLLVPAIAGGACCRIVVANEISTYFLMQKVRSYLEKASPSRETKGAMNTSNQNSRRKKFDDTEFQKNSENSENLRKT